MTKSEIEKLFDFSKYYENEEFDVELFDDILLLEEELIPLDRVKEFKKLLVPVWEKEKNLKEIAWYNIDAGRILASWGYKEGLDYLKTLITYGFKDVSTIYPHRLYGYDQVYEYILDAFTNYVLNFSNKGKKKEALKEVYLELCNIIERAKEEFISLSWFKYKMKDSEYYQLFKKPLKDTLDYLKNKEKKSFLDDYNIEDINKALLIKKDIKIKNNTKIKSENIDKHVNEKTEYLKKEFEYFFDKNKILLKEKSISKIVFGNNFFELIFLYDILFNNHLPSVLETILFKYTDTNKLYSFEDIINFIQYERNENYIDIDKDKQSQYITYEQYYANHIESHFIPFLNMKDNIKRLEEYLEKKVISKKDIVKEIEEAKYIEKECSIFFEKYHLKLKNIYQDNIIFANELFNFRFRYGFGDYSKQPFEFQGLIVEYANKKYAFYDIVKFIHYERFIQGKEKNKYFDIYKNIALKKEYAQYAESHFIPFLNMKDNIKRLEEYLEKERKIVPILTEKVISKMDIIREKMNRFEGFRESSIIPIEKEIDELKAIGLSDEYIEFVTEFGFAIVLEDLLNFLMTPKKITIEKIGEVIVFGDNLLEELFVFSKDNNRVFVILKNGEVLKEFSSFFDFIIDFLDDMLGVLQL